MLLEGLRATTMGYYKSFCNGFKFLMVSVAISGHNNSPLLQGIQQAANRPLHKTGLPSSYSSVLESEPTLKYWIFGFPKLSTTSALWAC